MVCNGSIYLGQPHAAAANLLTEFTTGKTFADYERDAMLRAAVEREFEIIGEAMTQLAKVDETVAARISHYQHVLASAMS